MKKQLSCFITVLLKMTKLLFNNSKIFLLISIFLCGIVGLSTGMNTLVKQYFFEAIENLPNNRNLELTIFIGLFWGIFTLITLFLQGICDVIMEDLGLRMGGIIGNLVNEKASKIDVICYEDINTLNLINKAYQGVEQSAKAIRISITLLSFYIPYFLFFTVYTYYINRFLSIIVLLVLIPTLAAQYYSSRYYAHLENEVAPTRRKLEYYKGCIVEREYARETRALGATFFFRNLYQASLLLFKQQAWESEKKSSLIEIGFRMISLVSYLLIICLLFIYLCKGDIGVAAFIAILTSIDQTFNYMDYVGNNIGDISSCMPSVINTFDFFHLQERVSKDIEISGHNIDFENVSFQYPGNSHFTLKNINISIRAGDTVAIVGENGAGKSTIAKLILGLYLPTDGNVCIGGYNTKNVSHDSIYRKCSAVFQNYCKYKLSLKKNVQISALDQEDHDLLLTDILKEVDIDARNKKTFPDGFETMLAREYGGVDLSGGQWQRIAIGRGIYKRHQIIVLDEPTAAIDPIEETRVYNKFVELSKGKTSLIITHRIGSARIADQIIVMVKGEVVGVGTHDQLLEKNNLYKRMYNSQAQWYE